MGSNVPPVEAVPPFWIGHHEHGRRSIVNLALLDESQHAGFDMVTTPITNQNYHIQFLSLVDSYLSEAESVENHGLVPTPVVPALTTEFTSLTPDTTYPTMLGVTSPWIDLGSNDPVISHISRQVLNQEIAYAAFCGMNNIIIPGPCGDYAGKLRETDVAEYARAIASAISVGPYIQLHISLPMHDADVQNKTPKLKSLASRGRPEFSTSQNNPSGRDVEGESLLASWEAWDLIRSVCNYDSRLSVALTIPKRLPDQAIQSRWYGEPLRILEFPRQTFVSNAKGYPVLAKPHQALVTRYMRLRQTPWILLSDIGSLEDASRAIQSAMVKAGPSPGVSDADPTPAEAAKTPLQAHDASAYLRYLRHLQQSQPERDMIDRFAAGYQDYLQSPLQPLTDNLESITYEVFEKDPIKYEWYERATAAALTDLYKELERPIVVTVVGAGRGPLVTRALAASASTGVPIQMNAVEKNPNAYVLLLRHNADPKVWNGRVTVTKSDMRSWAGPLQPDGKPGHVDILISELLGSFADNELSPECLDGVQRVLHPDHGINIPQSYTAHLTPIATPRIYADLLSRSSEDKWELPYVVMFNQFSYLSTLTSKTESENPCIQQTWEFTHPLSKSIIAQSNKMRTGTLAPGLSGGDGSNAHNERSTHLTFPIPNRGTCHGLAGYFETVLYKSPITGVAVELSTNPLTMDAKSKDMISWFPIFFPLKTPLVVPDNGDLTAHMWRCSDERKVWYEWLVEVHVIIGTKKMCIGRSEVHSSRANGCLM